MLFNQFDQVRIISLAHRKDRRREMTDQLNKVGVEIDGRRVAFFDACKVKNRGRFYSAGARGCFLSHMNVLETASGSILVLEDDCDFTSEAAQYIVPKCDIFYGGYLASDPADIQASDITGAHMMGYFNPNHVGAYFRHILENEEARDHRDMPVPDGAAVWYRRAYPEAVTVFAPVSLADQRPSRTDVADPHWIDRIRIAGTVARKIKRLIAV